VTDVKRRKHPHELRPAQPAVFRVEQEIVLIVPLDEPVLERRKENQERQDGDGRWDRQRR
jgi:hypothetical protein